MVNKIESDILLDIKSLHFRVVKHLRKRFRLEHTSLSTLPLQNVPYEFIPDRLKWRNKIIQARSSSTSRRYCFFILRRNQPVTDFLTQNHTVLFASFSAGRISDRRRIHFATVFCVLLYLFSASDKTKLSSAVKQGCATACTWFDFCWADVIWHHSKHEIYKVKIFVFLTNSP